MEFSNRIILICLLLFPSCATEVKPLPKPDLEWIGCNGDNAIVGLDYENFVQLQAFMESVKNTCEIQK